LKAYEPDLQQGDADLNLHLVLKKEQCHTSTPHTCLHDTHSENFTFTLY